MDKIDNIVSILINYHIDKPEGNNHPKQTFSETSSYERDPKVKTWVLKRSKGICEACNKEAPFINNEGFPYLEVHHLTLLSNGGSDTVENCIAVCPTCHRRLHFSKDKNEFLKTVKENVKLR